MPDDNDGWKGHATALPEALAQVTDASIAVDDWIASAEDTPTLAEIFATVDDAMVVLAMVRDIVKAAILRRSKWDAENGGWVMDDGNKFPYLLPGGGYLQRRGGKQATRYDQGHVIADVAKGIANELMEQDVAKAAIVSDGTLIPLEDLTQRVCARMAEAAGATAPSFTSWRSGIAKQLHVDLKRHVDESKTTEVSLSVEGRR